MRAVQVLLAANAVHHFHEGRPIIRLRCGETSGPVGDRGILAHVAHNMNTAPHDPRAGVRDDRSRHRERLGLDVHDRLVLRRAIVVQIQVDLVIVTARARWTEHGAGFSLEQSGGPAAAERGPLPCFALLHFERKRTGGQRVSRRVACLLVEDEFGVGSAFAAVIHVTIVALGVRVVSGRARRIGPVFVVLDGCRQERFRLRRLRRDIFVGIPPVPQETRLAEGESVVVVFKLYFGVGGIGDADLGDNRNVGPFLPQLLVFRGGRVVVHFR